MLQLNSISVKVINVYFSVAVVENPGCLFEQDHCNWKPNGTWKISKFSPLSFLSRDWQSTSGERLVENILNA